MDNHGSVGITGTYFILLLMPWRPISTVIFPTVPFTVEMDPLEFGRHRLVLNGQPTHISFVVLVQAGGFSSDLYIQILPAIYRKTYFHQEAVLACLSLNCHLLNAHWEGHSFFSQFVTLRCNAWLSSISNPVGMLLTSIVQYLKVEIRCYTRFLD